MILYTVYIYKKKKVLMEKKKKNSRTPAANLLSQTSTWKWTFGDCLTHPRFRNHYWVCILSHFFARKYSGSFQVILNSTQHRVKRGIRYCPELVGEPCGIVCWTSGNANVWRVPVEVFFLTKWMTLCPAIEHLSREGYDARATGGDGSSLTFITIPPIFKKE